ncbi:transcriptional regulator [Methanobrevibacter ruminantium M1]|uniref:Transcriptional regulator n=1 Tax=Methanobrevibacter ruminantium (strain ATCC 35063 / DSM 1093 / JCM 13430 / OCM 146 / M1) TaxID=634498 RepID=D3E0N5_METRM|nr:helix-turn-helix transcriptional regulator [Methanobrevibacter ruminantium]ADC46281.1 transcriptional regulator [Methanobrevibacter ruminantium M1]
MRNNLKIYRAIENITQKELADELGVSRQTIVLIENNKNDPSLELAFKIAHKFDVKIEDIFINDSNKK